MVLVILNRLFLVFALKNCVFLVLASFTGCWFSFITIRFSVNSSFSDVVINVVFSFLWFQLRRSETHFVVVL